MAGLSITRRRKAWLKGVVAGATGKGACSMVEPTLKSIFQRGVAHGQKNADSPYVRAIVEQHQRRRPARAQVPRSPRQRRPERRPGPGPSRWSGGR